MPILVSNPLRAVHAALPRCDVQRIHYSLRFARLPQQPEHRAELASCAFADLKSTGNGRNGGACTAAAFLENFIGLKGAATKPAWLHLDIAGPGMIKGAGTGFGTLSVIQYLMNAPAGPVAVDEE